jgi:hypothetical protein
MTPRSSFPSSITTTAATQKPTQAAAAPARPVLDHKTMSSGENNKEAVNIIGSAVLVQRALL